MYKFVDLRSVHLEMTTLCNAKCPMCARTEDRGKTNRRLPLTELSLEQIQRIFPKEFLQQLWEVYLCGNYGDPILAKDMSEALAYFKECNPDLTTKIHTNGSARSAQWWKNLARVCDQVYFGIDGLEDTNALYRIGTHFDKIMENAAAYIGAGGYAKWQFIVFRHNEHQIEEARKRAHSMGFKEFNLKKTGRFFSNTKLEVRQEKPVYNSKGEITHTLEMPTQPQYLNKALAKEADLLKRYGSMVNYLNSTQIKCQAVDTRSLYISADGLVFPCCWLGNQMYTWHKPEKSGEIWRLLEKLPGGISDISALNHSVADILAGPFFQKIIPESWELKTIADGRSWVCSKTCGNEFNQFKQQFEKNIQPSPNH